MGLTIHYNGKFDPSSSIAEMIEEVKDVAEAYNWEYDIFETSFPENSFDKELFNDEIYGIMFSPPKCEPVCFTFLSNGRMASPMGLQIWGKEKDPERKNYIYHVFTKTQFAGREIHKVIIHLFKYITDKYFSEFQMYDEGQYWETNDEDLLDEIFTRYEDALDIVGTALNNLPREENESFEDYFNRILRNIKRRGDESE